ncbi:hypothetical protein F2P79_020703 [Pimephales promelas]|nr:hypothetical protein F2P79_020703 [Pimephales promelas]
MKTTKHTQGRRQFRNCRMTSQHISHKMMNPGGDSTTRTHRPVLIEMSFIMMLQTLKKRESEDSVYENNKGIRVWVDIQKASIYSIKGSIESHHTASTNRGYSLSTVVPSVKKPHDHRYRSSRVGYYHFCTRAGQQLG